MRFREFRINENTALFEYDSEMSDEELKDLIVNRLRSEEDRSMLDKIYQALEQSTLDERIQDALAEDEDARTKLEVFAGMIMNTDGTFAEKNDFINNYEYGYVDTDRLTQMGQVQDFESWITGNDFVKRVFNNLYTYTPQGIGPGEFALAVLSPNIASSGRSAELAGDIVIGNDMVEVKAKQQAGGRFFDGRKAKMDQRSVERAFNELGIDVGKGISGKMWADKVRPQVPQDKLEPLVEIIIRGAFAFVKLDEAQTLKTALMSGNTEQIKQAWGLLSYENYKRMSKFDSMLLLDGPKRHSLYFKDASTVADILKSGMPYVVGPEQQIHPQMAFKI